eukprot:1040058-Rhodomonas_salina.3
MQHALQLPTCDVGFGMAGCLECSGAKASSGSHLGQVRNSPKPTSRRQNSPETTSSRLRCVLSGADAAVVVADLMGLWQHAAARVELTAGEPWFVRMGALDPALFAELKQKSVSLSPSQPQFSDPTPGISDTGLS